MYIALGVNLEGQKEYLGLWIADIEGARTELSILTELKNRGLNDILIACVDGLRGFPRRGHYGVCANEDPTVHCPHGAERVEIRQLERLEGAVCRSEANLPLDNGG